MRCARGSAMARPEEGLVQARMTRLILPFTRGEWTSHAVPGGKALANPHDCEEIHGRRVIRCLQRNEGAAWICGENAMHIPK